MRPQKHIIREQLIELTVSNREDAWALQQEAGRIFRQRILPLIDRYCSKLAPDTLIRIDTLLLDLGELDPKRLGQDLEEKMHRHLKSELAKVIRRQERTDSSSKGSFRTASQLELLQHFLHTGALPWWADSEDPELLSKAVRHLLTRQPGTIIRQVLAPIREEKYLNRLIYHFSDDLLLELLKAIDRQFFDFGKRLYSDLIALVAVVPAWRTLPFKRLRREIWKGIFYAVTVSDVASREEVVFDKWVVLHLASHFGFSLEQWKVVLADTKSANCVSEENGADGGGKEALHRLQSSLPEAITLLGGQDGAMGVKERERMHLLDEEPFVEVAGVKAAGDTDELYIHNAGLVILWPFLPRFFENLGLMQDKTFVDAAAPHRAAATLQYLASGQADPPEYLLPLNKIICGIDLEDPFEVDFELEDAELEACDRFLEAVIAHAPILRNMSIGGFRNTFLQRQGILSFEDGHWMLRIERETYDLVLDRFPWSFKIIKLPWMDFVLYVEW
ncbi:MAG: hypothetical protein KDC75_03735 [Phaeodactylibacter sp.]|nr:hypothetical protein [Phaeodactylibacter sp.]MCB9304651.1 hypothetical protein [Lewinellaceae bacterium]